MSSERCTVDRHLVHRAFGWLLVPLRGLRVARIMHAPRTALDRFSRQTVQHIEAQGLPALDDLFRVLEALSAAEWKRAERRLLTNVATSRRRMERQPTGASVLRLFDALHREYPYVPLLAVPEPEHGLRVLECEARLNHASAARGEQRARLVSDATAHIAESTYRPYATALLKLIAIRQGKPRLKNPSFGNVVQALEQHTAAYPGIIEPDVVRVRNAIFHGHTVYVSATHSMRLSAGRWHRTFPISELQQLARRMLRVAGTLYPTAVSAFLFEAMQPALQTLPRIVRAHAAGDEASFRQACDGIFQHYDQLLAQLRGLAVR